MLEDTYTHRAKAPRPLCFVSREAPGTHAIGRA